MARPAFLYPHSKQYPTERFADLEPQKLPNDDSFLQKIVDRQFSGHSNAELIVRSGSELQNIVPVSTRN